MTEHVKFAERTPDKPAPITTGTTGTATLVRVIGLPLAAFVVFMAVGSGQQVAKSALPIFVGLSIAIYFLPTIEAMLRKHHSLTSIVLVNLFFGWTLIGWVAAIAWACAGSNKPATTTASNSNVAPARAEPSVTPRTTADTSVADELQKLAALRDQGVLSEEEFSQQKAKVLG